jgi:hypothetical protein
MLLDSRANDGLTSSLPASVARRQTLSLEGDFDRHFHLYCPLGYERDALYLFTPDLMAVLIDHAGDFDVEVVDQRAYFFTNRTLDLTSAEVWAALDAILSSVTPKIKRVATRYADARSDGGADVATQVRGTGQVASQPASQFASQVARPGRRRATRRRMPLRAYAVGGPILVAALLVGANALGETLR